MELALAEYKRLWVIFAGIYVELVICAGALVVWSFTAPGSWLYDSSYKLALMTSITGLLMNLNPLMKFDGYYALAQWLKIDNMREEAFEYLKRWLRRTLLGHEVELPQVGRRRRRIFLIYGLLAYAYTVLILYLVAHLAYNVFSAWFGDYGDAGFVACGGHGWRGASTRASDQWRDSRNSGCACQRKGAEALLPSEDWLAAGKGTDLEVCPTVPVAPAFLPVGGALLAAGNARTQHMSKQPRRSLVRLRRTRDDKPVSPVGVANSRNWAG